MSKERTKLLEEVGTKMSNNIMDRLDIPRDTTKANVNQILDIVFIDALTKDVMAHSLVNLMGADKKGSQRTIEVLEVFTQELSFALSEVRYK